VTASNLATIRRLYEAFDARDSSAISELFAEDVELWQTPELPWGGSFRGHEGVFSHFLTLIAHINSRLVHESLFVAGDHVLQSGRSWGTVVANGASFDVAEVHVWVLRDDKIVRYEGYVDTPAMLDALGR
jgi:uncharacterized protein